MTGMRNNDTPPPDEIAAALAAVYSYIADEQPSNLDAAAPRPWRTAAAFEAQGLPPTRHGAYRTWGQAERAKRASRWSYGIAGL